MINDDDDEKIDEIDVVEIMEEDEVADTTLPSVEIFE